MTLNKIGLKHASSHDLVDIAADFLPPFLNDFLQHLWIMPTAPAAPQPVAATHLFTQTASAAMLSHEGLILEDIPPFTQYTAFSNKGECMLSACYLQLSPRDCAGKSRPEHCNRFCTPNCRKSSFVCCARQTEPGCWHGAAERVVKLPGMMCRAKRGAA